MPDLATATTPLWEQHRTRLAAYTDSPDNFDASRISEYTSASGWHLDDYAIDLPPENPGPAATAGSFAAAQDVLYRYAFPPPKLIVGIFQPDVPLEKRIMLLRAQFLGFRFWFGVRIVEVVDEAARPSPAGPERVWGYGYRTLQGHFEMGQINFSIHKNLTTGVVQFRIHSVSRTGRIRNPSYWVGFKLFGRTLQRRFARQSLTRMRQLVTEALAAGQTKAVTQG